MAWPCRSGRWRTPTRWCPRTGARTRSPPRTRAARPRPGRAGLTAQDCPWVNAGRFLPVAGLPAHRPSCCAPAATGLRAGGAVQHAHADARQPARATSRPRPRWMKPGWRGRRSAYVAPPVLPTDLYADASHPLGAGYLRLAEGAVVRTVVPGVAARLGSQTGPTEGEGANAMKRMCCIIAMVRSAADHCTAVGLGGGVGAPVGYRDAAARARPTSRNAPRGVPLRPDAARKGDLVVETNALTVAFASRLGKVLIYSTASPSDAQGRSHPPRRSPGRALPSPRRRLRETAP